jgi:hypothetical protein
MVEAGLGVALVPLLTTVGRGGRPMFDVDLYPVPEFERPIVALVPPQYLRAQPFAAFVDALKAAGAALEPPALPPAPPFLTRPAAGPATRTMPTAAGSDPVAAAVQAPASA